MPDAPRIDQLLVDLKDYTVGDSVSGSTAFGDTGYDPKVDFPVARRAVEELVARGPGIIPQMLAVLVSNDTAQAYFAAEVLGRLRAVEAIGLLEELVRFHTPCTIRMNYDQFTGYPVCDQAFDALTLIDRARALGVLRSVAESTTPERHWAKARLAGLA